MVNGKLSQRCSPVFRPEKHRLRRRNKKAKRDPRNVSLFKVDCMPPGRSMQLTQAPKNPSLTALNHGVFTQSLMFVLHSPRSCHRQVPISRFFRPAPDIPILFQGCVLYFRDVSCNECPGLRMASPSQTCSTLLLFTADLSLCI